VVACLPLDPRFAGSNPAEDDGFLRVYKSVARLPSEGKFVHRQQACHPLL
jgi:hypothetical protein